MITLIADRPIVTGQALAGDAFATPTIVHFGAVLLLSAIVALRGTESAAPQFFGVIIVARCMRMQSVYTPKFEDWLFHVLLPFAAYTTLAASAYPARSRAHGAMFGIGAAALLLLFIGIHDAWDAVTYHICFINKRGRGEAERPR